jgi:hypothetical protein
MPSGTKGPHGLTVTVYSGPNPTNGHALAEHAETNPLQSGQPSGSDHSDGAQPFTRSEVVSVRLEGLRPRPFSVLVSTHTPGAILIESVEISICEEDEPVFNIPVSASSVLLNKPGDGQVFRLTDQQLDAISRHLEHGNTIKVRVQYLAADRSELNISIVPKHSHHKLRYVLAMIAVGFTVPALVKQFSHPE